MRTRGDGGANTIVGRGGVGACGRSWGRHMHAMPAADGALHCGRPGLQGWAASEAHQGGRAPQRPHRGECRYLPAPPLRRSSLGTLRICVLLCALRRSRDAPAALWPNACEHLISADQGPHGCFDGPAIHVHSLGHPAAPPSRSLAQSCSRRSAQPPLGLGLHAEHGPRHFGPRGEFRQQS